jgi:general nucleoside transport system permease protein
MAGAAALGLTALASGALLAVGGYDPLAAARAMLAGAFGSRDAVLSITLVRSVPLILTGLAVALAFRAGVWNIGAEGQLYAGAIAGVWVGLSGAELPAWLLVPAVLLASAGAGVAWALIPALMRIRWGVGEVITTILMNFVGIHLAAFMVHGPLQEPRGVFPQTDQIALAARLPAMVPGTRLHLGFALAVALAIALSLMLRRTRMGFRVRAVGASPEAAVVSGRIDARRVVLLSFLASGALAGLGGGVEVAGLTYALYEGLSPGWGYTAIAVALLAGLSPLAVLGTGILFGALEAGAGAMQRDAGIPAVWVVAVQALIILAVLAIDRLRRRRPLPGTVGAAMPAGATGEAAGV